MSENRRIRPRRLSGLLASVVPSWILVPVLLVVPAALPLCAMEVEACAVDLPIAPPASHCPMDATGLGTMPCCVEDSAPQGSVPAVPGKADAGDRLQLTALAPAPALAAVFFAAAVIGPAAVPSSGPSAPAVPLYTLHSTLLN